MTKTEAFQKIMDLFKKNGFVKDEKKFESAKTTDGKMLQWEGDLKPGTPVNVIGDDGNPVPADGTYEMPDGTKVVCAAGLCTDMQQKQADAGAGEPDFAKALGELFDKFKTVMDQFTAMQTKFTDIETKFTQISTSVEDAAKKQTEMMVELGKELEVLGKEPIEENDPPRNSLFKKTKKEDDSAMNRILKIRAELAKNKAKN